MYKLSFLLKVSSISSRQIADYFASSVIKFDGATNSAPQANQAATMERGNKI